MLTIQVVLEEGAMLDGPWVWQLRFVAGGSHNEGIPCLSLHLCNLVNVLRCKSEIADHHHDIEDVDPIFSQM